MKTGIYKIINKITNDFYIGSAAVSFEKRFSSHKSSLNSNKHWNKYLQNAWNKYGSKNFCFEIIEFVPKSECIEREQFYLNLLKPKYNLSPTAGSPLGFKHNEKTKKKIALKRIGQKHSEETKNKLSIKKMGNKNPMFGKVGKLNPSSRCVILHNLSDNKDYLFDSIKNLSEFCGIKRTTLSMVLSGKNSGKNLKERGFIINYEPNNRH